MHSPEEIQAIRNMAEDNKSDKEIADSLALTWQGVRSVRRRLGIANRGVAAANQETKSRQRYDWVSVDWSQSNSQIARKLGCHWSAVSDARARSGKVRVQSGKIDPQKYGTETEVSEAVSVPRTTIQSAVDRGEILHVATFGGTRLVEIASAKKWAKNRPSRGRKPQAEST
jgi:DNA-binding CsgD family transcriptional regulator